MSENNFLNTAKQNLVERATFYYIDRRNDLNVTEADYRDHFKQLGNLLFEIDITDSITGVISLIESNEFGQIGLFRDDVEEFLEEVLKDTYRKK